VRAERTPARENRLEDGLSKLNSVRSCNPVPDCVWLRRALIEVDVLLGELASLDGPKAIDRTSASGVRAPESLERR
jgi:hypothetical protein